MPSSSVGATQSASTVLGIVLRRSPAQRLAQSRCSGDGHPSTCPCHTRSRALDWKLSTVLSCSKIAECANKITTDPSWKLLIKSQTIVVFLKPASQEAGFWLCKPLLRYGQWLLKLSPASPLQTVTHLASKMPSYSDSCLIKPALGRVILRFCFT